MLGLIVAPCLLVVLVLAALFFYFFSRVPLSSEIGSKPTVILDRTGKVEFGTLQPEFSRKEISLAQLCPQSRHHVCDAVLAAEDATFYEHRGVSFVGIARAALRNVSKREVTQGGSTITQQYLKTVTGDDERSVRGGGLRKIREAALAIKLERQYSKDEILELYLNQIYFGRGAYGIQAAAQAYFGVDATELDVAQAAQLAGLIPAPSAYDPLENPEAAGRRYDYVLERMTELGWLEPAEALRLRGQRPQVVAREAINFNGAPFFLDIVRRELERELGEKIYTGLRVTTTLDLDRQGDAERAYHLAFDGIPPTGALVALDPATGGIVALVGGENYQTDQFNLATAPRQPGSTFKPFALTAWIEDGKSPDSYFDAPARITLPKADDGKDWRVNNYEQRRYEPLSLRSATWSSVNTVYAQVQKAVGPRATADVASRASGRTGSAAFPPFASLVLGTEEVTPLELAEAYNTYAAGGVHRAAFAVVEARRDGEVVYRHTDDGEQVIDPDVAWKVTEVLQGVISSGSGKRAAIGRPAAGKTGTTQAYGDAWFAGYTRQLTAVVWMGNRDNNEPMKSKPTGGELPAVTWHRFMSTALDGTPIREFPESDLDNLVVVRGRPDPEPDCDDDEIAVRVDDEDGEEEDGADASDESDGERRRRRRHHGTDDEITFKCVPVDERDRLRRDGSDEDLDLDDDFGQQPIPGLDLGGFGQEERSDAREEPLARRPDEDRPPPAEPNSTVSTSESGDPEPQQYQHRRRSRSGED